MSTPAVSAVIRERIAADVDISVVGVTSFSGPESPFDVDVFDSTIDYIKLMNGRGEHAERQVFSIVVFIAEEFNVAVYITNQVIVDPGGGMFITDPKKPARGHVLAHAVAIRLMLRKGKGEQRADGSGAPPVAGRLQAQDHPSATVPNRTPLSPTSRPRRKLALRSIASPPRVLLVSSLPHFFP
ncbi:hypothetical protein ABZP36_025853 [Zizania latifolia]